MSNPHPQEPLLEAFIFETSQQLEQLEHVILMCEKSGSYNPDNINEIFRIMHTIKGSSAAMLFNNVSNLAHAVEDLFFYIREKKTIDFKTFNCAYLADLALECVDFIKVELEKIKSNDAADGDASVYIDKIVAYLAKLKDSESNPANKSNPEQPSGKEQQKNCRKKAINKKSTNNFKAVIYFQDNCEMENIRAYSIINNLEGMTGDIYYTPENIIESDAAAEAIRKAGFTIWFKADRTYEEMHEFFMQTVFLKTLELIKLDGAKEIDRLSKGNMNSVIDLSDTAPKLNNEENTGYQEKDIHANHQSIISVQVEKLDKLMDLMGEIVIAEAMVTQNPDLKGLELENFHKASRQLHKITSELQDTVMSIRMVPLSTTFQKMHRIVRDMSRKLDKEVRLELIGEATEVDKNIIEHISDPLMHLVRNAIDHGIETVKEREAIGKPRAGKVTLEARNIGSDVLIIVKDDGKGLNKEKIIKRAMECDLLFKPENEMSDREIYSLIFLPGFSTTDCVSEFSGRGVGMDVVTKNIGLVGGTVTVDCVEGSGSTVTLKIPLTLAIIDGMNVKVGNSCYTIPTTAIKESFKPKESDIVKDPDENEMIMLRGECFPIIRLHRFYNVKTNIMDFTEGILIMVEHENRTSCIFADELLGQQQVVVKMLPNYIKNTRRIQGLAGCTLLGDGSISLILDIGGLISNA